MRTSEYAPRARGFTLLEILVVITLVAILTGTVMLTITGADSAQRLQGAAEQLAYRTELARHYALQRNREWGIYVEEAAVRFAEFDPDQSAWVEQSQRPFGAPLGVDNVTLRIEAEQYRGLSDRDRERLPQVLLFSSGEVTPFQLYLEPARADGAWQVGSDGLARVRASRVDA